jgi:two-component system repressor protein LuxO
VKPFNRARLTVTPNNGLTKRSLPAALRSLREKRADDRFFNFIGAAPAMQAVYKTIEAVSASIVALNGAGVVTVSTLPPVLLHQGPAAQDTADIGTMPLAEPEEHLMIQALQHTGNDVPRVAALLEADSSTIYRKLQSCRC